MSKKYFGTDGIRGRVNQTKINGEMLSVDTEEDFKKIEALEKERFTLSIL